MIFTSSEGFFSTFFFPETSFRGVGESREEMGLTLWKESAIGALGLLLFLEVGEVISILLTATVGPRSMGLERADLG